MVESDAELALDGIEATELAWAICAASSGAGPGKCDLSYCFCAEEARVLLKVLTERGWKITRVARA